jgi:hypothetical protein
MGVLEGVSEKQQGVFEMSLTDTTLRAVKPTDKQQKFFDGGGLFLLVTPSGTKSWRLKYRFQGKENLITLGLYPTVSLKEAREHAATAKKILAGGKDPLAERKQGKLQLQNTFELVAREWHEKQAPAWSANYYKKTLDNLVKNAFPYLGNRAIAEINAQELLTMLRRLEARGTIATAHAIRGLCTSIFRYAVATGRAERNPVTDIYGALAPHVRKHHPAITDPDKLEFPENRVFIWIIPCNNTYNCKKYCIIIRFQDWFFGADDSGGGHGVLEGRVLFFLCFSSLLDDRVFLARYLPCRPER